MLGRDSWREPFRRSVVIAPGGDEDIRPRSSAWRLRSLPRGCGSTRWAGRRAPLPGAYGHQPTFLNSFMSVGAMLWPKSWMRSSVVTSSSARLLLMKICRHEGEVRGVRAGGLSLRPVPTGPWHARAVVACQLPRASSGSLAGGRYEDWGREWGAGVGLVSGWGRAAVGLVSGWCRAAVGLVCRAGLASLTVRFVTNWNLTKGRTMVPPPTSLAVSSNSWCGFLSSTSSKARWSLLMKSLTVFGAVSPAWSKARDGRRTLAQAGGSTVDRHCGARAAEALLRRAT